MTSEAQVAANHIWTARTKLTSFHLLPFSVADYGSRTPREGEVESLPWRDDEERKLRLAALEGHPWFSCP